MGSASENASLADLNRCWYNSDEGDGAWTWSQKLSGWKRLLGKMVKPDSLTGGTLSGGPGRPSALVGLGLPGLRPWPAQWLRESPLVRFNTWPLPKGESLPLFWVTSQKNPDSGSSGHVAAGWRHVPKEQSPSKLRQRRRGQERGRRENRPPPWGPRAQLRLPPSAPAPGKPVAKVGFPWPVTQRAWAVQELTPGSGHRAGVRGWRCRRQEAAVDTMGTDPSLSAMPRHSSRSWACLLE